MHLHGLRYRFLVGRRPCEGLEGGFDCTGRLETPVVLQALGEGQMVQVVSPNEASQLENQGNAVQVMSLHEASQLENQGNVVVSSNNHSRSSHVYLPG
jgi:hypothetical protein